MTDGRLCSSLSEIFFRKKMKTVVVSAVNLRKGGTLTILKDCLRYLSGRCRAGEVRVIALVHRRELCDFPGIEYIEMPWCIKTWAHRLWAEYVTMKRISRRLALQAGEPVDVWLSLHDTTPNVLAKRREVYCHTSFPFLKLKLRDWWMNPKIPLFSVMGRLYFRINVHKNDCIIVQQHWFAKAMSDMLGVPMARFMVIPPVCAALPANTADGVFTGAAPDSAPCASADGAVVKDVPPLFFYASTPDCHKNFETLCEASRLLEAELGRGKFRTIITVRGDENRYARWLYRKWGKVKSIDFHGFMSKEELFATYAAADCFVFPSRVETWGLPITEYMAANPRGRLLLADLPYARETFSGGCENASCGDGAVRSAGWFAPCGVDDLRALMKREIVSES